MKDSKVYDSVIRFVLSDLIHFVWFAKIDHSKTEHSQSFVSPVYLLVLTYFVLVAKNICAEEAACDLEGINSDFYAGNCHVSLHYSRGL